MIDTSKAPLDGDYALIVTYYPVYEDGSLGHRQEAQYAWNGPAANEADLVQHAKDHLARKHRGSGGDRVTAARLVAGRR